MEWLVLIKWLALIYAIGMRPVRALCGRQVPIFLDALGELGADGTDCVCQKIASGVEFLSEGAVSTLDAAVVFGPARWQHDQGDGHVGAGLFRIGP